MPVSLMERVPSRSQGEEASRHAGGRCVYGATTVHLWEARKWKLSACG